MSILVIGYLLVALVMLWYFIKTKGLWSRVVTVLIVVGYGTALLYMVPSLMGWPLQVKSMPDKTNIVLYLVQEPTKTKAGWIYFWTTMDLQEPRAYKIAYDKALHKKIVQATKNMPKGARIIVKNKGKGREAKGWKGGGLDTDPHDMIFEIVTPKQSLRKHTSEQQR